MSRLNHDRPVFKVIDAGGGERIRTIAEDLRAAQAADRRQRRDVRCDTCRTTKKVVLPHRRCRGCLADERTISRAKRRLRASGTQDASGLHTAPAAQHRNAIAAAEARIAERRRAHAGRRKATNTVASSPDSASRRSDVQAAERAVEVARKELLLARTDWERDLLRRRYKRAQDALSAAQRLDRQRRSLT